jgi:VanZ family protein
MQSSMRQRLKPDFKYPFCISMLSFSRRYRLSISWGFFILLLTGIPGQYFPRVPAFIDLFSPDKLVHLFLFGMFVFFLLRELARNSSLSFNFASILAFLISIALGGITEILQGYVFTNRQCSIYDFIANGVGSGIALLICLIWKRLLPVRKEKQVNS